MELKIDSREGKVLELFKGTTKNITQEQLLIGDFTIYKNNELVVLIERKTLSDLVSSLIDGRYNEQSLRLNNHELNNHNIIYLIEGNISNFNSKIKRFDKHTIYSIMTTLSLYKGFSVINTFSLQESFNFINKLYEKIEKSSDKMFYLSSTNAANEDYCSVIKQEKSANITPENIDEIMLMQIPNVSSNISKIIMEKYNTIENLINELKNNETILDNIKCLTKTNKERKINKTTIENIKKYLIK